MGGFTTLSAASEQTRALLDAGRPGAAAAYVVGSLAAALLAVTAVHARAAQREDDRTARGEGP
jgi:fluoride exporter